MKRFLNWLIFVILLLIIIAPAPRDVYDLHYAIISKQSGTALEILKELDDEMISKVSADGRTLIMEAARQGLFKVVKAMLDKMTEKTVRCKIICRSTRWIKKGKQF